LKLSSSIVPVSQVRATLTIFSPPSAAEEAAAEEAVLVEEAEEPPQAVRAAAAAASHSQEVTTRNLHKKVSFIFNPSRAGLQMQALAHLLVQV